LTPFVYKTIISVNAKNKEVVMMRKFLLRGLAEGISGRSFIMAKCPEDVFLKIPALQQVRNKLIVNGDTISGFCACDG
jgi:hypothetical protein